MTREQRGWTGLWATVVQDGDNVSVWVRGEQLIEAKTVRCAVLWAHNNGYRIDAFWRNGEEFDVQY